MDCITRLGRVVLGSIGASAHTVAASRAETQAQAVAKNAFPLSPAGAAGIRKAQGASDRGVLIVSGLILGGIVAALLLVDDDEENTPTTTGSN